MTTRWGTEGGRARLFGMGNDSRRDLDQQLETFERKLPDPIARVVRWARGRGSGFVRIPLALVLIAAGFVGFLPILGFWMIPLGLVLIAQDVPFLRPPMARMLAWINDKWRTEKGTPQVANGDQRT